MTGVLWSYRPINGEGRARRKKRSLPPVSSPLPLPLFSLSFSKPIYSSYGGMKHCWRRIFPGRWVVTCSLWLLFSLRLCRHPASWRLLEPRYRPAPPRLGGGMGDEGASVGSPATWTALRRNQNIAPYHSCPPNMKDSTAPPMATIGMAWHGPGGIVSVIVVEVCGLSLQSSRLLLRCWEKNENKNVKRMIKTETKKYISANQTASFVKLTVCKVGDASCVSRGYFVITLSVVIRDVGG